MEILKKQYPSDYTFMDLKYDYNNNKENNTVPHLIKSDFNRLGLLCLTLSKHVK